MVGCLLMADQSRSRACLRESPMRPEPPLDRIGSSGSFWMTRGWPDGLGPVTGSGALPSPTAATRLTALKGRSAARGLSRRRSCAAGSAPEHRQRACVDSGDGAGLRAVGRGPGRGALDAHGRPDPRRGQRGFHGAVPGDRGGATRSNASRCGLMWANSRSLWVEPSGKVRKRPGNYRISPSLLRSSIFRWCGSSAATASGDFALGRCSKRWLR